MPVLVVSGHDESVYAEIAFRAGALGYLMKSDALEKIVSAIRRVLSGNVYVSDALASGMLQRQVRRQPEYRGVAGEGLSDRELEVFQLIGNWKKTKEIARELHLSIKTIEYYREQIKQKLELKSAVELTQHATSWVQRETRPESVVFRHRSWPAFRPGRGRGVLICERFLTPGSSGPPITGETLGTYSAFSPGPRSCLAPIVRVSAWA